MVESNKILEKILWLTSNDIDLCIKPDIEYGHIQIRLSKGIHHIAHVINPEAAHDSYCWKSDEDWFLYVLTTLEFKLNEYIKRLEEYAL